MFRMGDRDQKIIGHPFRRVVQHSLFFSHRRGRVQRINCGGCAVLHHLAWADCPDPLSSSSAFALNSPANRRNSSFAKRSKHSRAAFRHRIARSRKYLALIALASRSPPPWYSHKREYAKLFHPTSQDGYEVIKLYPWGEAALVIVSRGAWDANDT